MKPLRQSAGKSLDDFGLIFQQGLLNISRQSGDGTAGDGRTGDVVDFAAVFGHLVGAVLLSLELIKEMVDDPAEYTELMVFIQQLSGFKTLQDEVDEAKN